MRTADAMLKPSKMFSDLMFAVSMYFADALKKRLLKYNEHFWSLLLVASFVTLFFGFRKKKNVLTRACF